MLQHAMPGESLLSNGISGDKLTSPSGNAPPTYQELQEKVQELQEKIQELQEELREAEKKAAKFTANRKRFRDAIDFLTVQVKDSEQLAKDNEALQKDCEKERQRTEAERKRAEEEKALREKIEKAGLSTKEQLVLVQKRVEDVARTSKSDRDDVERFRKEVKQVVSRLSQAVQAVEGAHVSFHSLEGKLLSKVSNVELASSKSSSLAQKAICDVRSTQGKATTAENLSRTLVSQIAGLDQRLKGLTHEICMRLLDHPEDGLKTKVVRFPSGLGAAEDAESFPKKGVVLPDSQQQTGAFVNALNPAIKDSRVEGSGVSPRALLATVKSAPSTVVPLRGDSSAELNSHSPNVGHVSVSQVPPSGAFHGGQVFEKPPIVCSSPLNDSATHGCFTTDPNLQEDRKVPVTPSYNTVREALEAAKKKKDVLKVSSTSKVAFPPRLICTLQRSSPENLQKNSADEIREFAARTSVHTTDIAKLSSSTSNDARQPRLVFNLQSSHPESLQKNTANKVGECLVPTKVDSADILNVSSTSRNALPLRLVSSGPSSCSESLQKDPADEIGDCVVPTNVDSADVLKVSLTSRNALPPTLVSNGPSSGPESLQKNPAEDLERGVVRTKVDSADIVKASSTSRNALPPRLVSNGPSSPFESLQENPVDEIEECVVQTKVDSPNGSKPAIVEAEKTVNDKEVLKCLASTQGNKVCPSLGRSSTENPLGISYDNGAQTSAMIANPVLRAFSGDKMEAEMLQSGIATAANCSQRDKIPVSLLRDVTKLFEKERKVHARLEGKFAALARALQDGLEDPAQEDAEKKVGKRKRRKSMKDVCRKQICTQSKDERVIVSSRMIAPSTHKHCRDTEDGPFEGGAVEACKLVIRGSITRKESIPAAVLNLSQLGGICEESRELGSKLLEVMQDQELQGSGKEGKILACHQNLLKFEMEAEEVMLKVQLMFEDSKDLSGGNSAGEWHSESESSDSRDDWWVRQHDLLSPMRQILPPPSLHETMEPNTLSTWPAEEDMSLDDFSLLIDTLPSVDQVHVVTDQTMTDAGNLKIWSEDNCSLSTPISEKADDKENVAEGVSGHDGPVCLPPWSPSFVLFPQEADVGAQGDNSRNSGCASSCAAGEQSMELNSMEWVAENTCEHLYGLHSLELVWCPSACEPDMVSHAPKEASNLHIKEMSANINLIMGNVRKLFHEALTHIESGEAGSYPQPAKQMVSILSDSKFSNGIVLCIFTASLVDSFALWNGENQATSLISEQTSLQHLADIVQQVFLSQVFHGVLLPNQVHSVFANCLLHFIMCGDIRPFCQSRCEQTMEVIDVSEQYFYFTTNSSNMNNHHALISGSKLLASYCEKTGKKDFLSNSVYLILRFCEKESFWLLTSLSSFASVYCKSLFTVDSTDLVGQAILVVIAELLRDAEMCTQMEGGRENSQALLGSTVDTESQLEVEQNSINQVKQSFNYTQLFKSFLVLEEIVGDKTKLQFDGLLPKLLSALHAVISPTVDLVLPDNRHLFQNRMCVKPFNQMKWTTATFPALDNSDLAEGASKSIPTHIISNGRDGSVYKSGESDEGGTMSNEFRWQSGTQSSILSSELQPVIQLKQMTNTMDDWEQKFSNLVNAVELIAFHLGWNWTYNEFIVEHLWKLMTPGASAMTLVCVAHLFSTLGCLGRDVDRSDLPGVEGLRTSLSVVLNSDLQRSSSTGDKFNLPVWAQVSVAESLLVLSGWNWNKIISNEGTGSDAMSFSDLHKQSTKCLLNWFQSLGKEVQQTLPPSLRCAFADNFKELA